MVSEYFRIIVIDSVAKQVMDLVSELVIFQKCFKVHECIYGSQQKTLSGFAEGFRGKTEQRRAQSL